MKSSLAQHLIHYLGNPKPTLKQIALMESLIGNLSIQLTIIMDGRLAKREQECLRLAAAGHNVATTAEILNLSTKTVEQYRQAIRKKLGCKNMAQAVAQGIKYGYLAP